MNSARRNMASMSQRWGLRQPAQHRRERAAAAGLLPGTCPAAAPGAGLAGMAKLLSGTGIVASWILRKAEQDSCFSVCLRSVIVARVR